VTTNVDRHARFITALSSKLNESELWELIQLAQKNEYYDGKNDVVPVLSKRQQELCDWLCSAGYAQAADERLKAALDVANVKIKAFESERYDALRVVEEVKRQVTAIRHAKQTLDEKGGVLLELLKNVPNSESRY
jgi:hypothetical protein